MMVTTTKGLMDTSLLEKREGVKETDNDRQEWVEYWLDGELVHRSAHIKLKKAVFAMGEVNGFDPWGGKNG